VAADVAWQAWEPETAAALSGLTPFPALALNGAVVQWALDSVAVALGPCPDEAGACAMKVSMTSVDGVVAYLRTFQVYVSVILRQVEPGTHAAPCAARPRPPVLRWGGGTAGRLLLLSCDHRWPAGPVGLLSLG
jgi:hypothetical protein